MADRKITTFFMSRKITRFSLMLVLRCSSLSHTTSLFLHMIFRRINTKLVKLDNFNFLTFTCKTTIPLLHSCILSQDCLAYYLKSKVIIIYIYIYIYICLIFQNFYQIKTFVQNFFLKNHNKPKLLKYIDISNMTLILYFIL
jgi:hypothetical protein